MRGKSREIGEPLIFEEEDPDIGVRDWMRPIGDKKAPRTETP